MPGDNARVSFNTPAHKGVNLRRQSNSSSELIYTLSEGTEVIIVEKYNKANNGYIKVKAYISDYNQSYEGWVLADYITKS